MKLIISAIASVLALGAAMPALAQSGEPIKFGALRPMTGGGAAIGAALDVSVKMAVKEINEKGGILGRPVQLVLADTQSDPTIATSEAKRLVHQERVHAVLGPLISQEAIPAVTVTTEGKVFHVTSGATLELTPQVGPYHFSVASNAVAQGVALVTFSATTLKAKSVGILADNGGQSKSALPPMREKAAALNVKIAAEQEYPFRADDLTPQLLSLRRANPEALLFISSNYEDTSKLLTTLRDIGWNPKVVGNVSVPAFAPNLAKALGPGVFDNVYGESFTGLTYCTGEAMGSGEYVRFKDRLKAFSPETDGKIPAPTALYFYDAVTVVKAAMEGAKSTDAAQVSAWLENNASSIKLITTQPAASKQTHHLWGPDSLVMVEKPHESRSDGLQKRAGC